MQFKEGTHVYTADHQDVGTIDRVVLDPKTDEVSDVIIRQGWLFSEDKVLPVNLIDQATDDRVTLRKTEANLQKLPTFEETYYVPASEDDYAEEEDDIPVTPMPYAEPLYGYPPVGTAWWGFGSYMGYPPVDGHPDLQQRVQQNIPEGDVAVREGARVLSLEGDHVGKVEDVFIDEATRRATHLVISKGVLFKERKLIPTNWVKDAGEEEVMLTVNTHVVDLLPEYRG